MRCRTLGTGRSCGLKQKANALHFYTAGVKNSTMHPPGGRGEVAGIYRHRGCKAAVIVPVRADATLYFQEAPPYFTSLKNRKKPSAFITR